MKKIIILLSFFVFSFAGFQSSAQGTYRFISYIKDSGSWYYVYDNYGNVALTVSKSNGTILGWGYDWFVIRNGSWIYLCDMTGRKYHTQSVSSYGDVIAISSQNYITFNGSWYYIFDKYGRKVDVRSK